MPDRIVGVLGGMGPAATADFYTKLIAATPATRDQDHLLVVVWADPSVPDRSAALLGLGPDPTPVLRQGVQRLADAGAQVLAVPCNTAHAFVAPLAVEAGIQLISIIEVTAAWLRAELGSGGCAGLLATPGTVTSGLYHRACAVRGVRVHAPDAARQEAVTAAIAAVKAGRVTTGVVADLVEAAADLTEHGAEVIVAGCTEVVLALEGAAVPAPIVDPAVLLAAEVVLQARLAPRSASLLPSAQDELRQ